MPTIVQATESEAVFVFNFPLGPDFPTDGRVEVLEGRSGGPSDIISMADTDAKMFPGHVSLITIGSGIPAYLKTGNGTSGVTMSLSSNVWVLVNFWGPALPPATAQKLAETFG